MSERQVSIGYVEDGSITIAGRAFSIEDPSGEWKVRHHSSMQRVLDELGRGHVVILTPSKEYRS